jgi:prolyl oligopeptidase
MATATQLAVGMNPNPDPTIYPVTVQFGGSAVGPRPGEEPYRWLENLDTPAVKQWIEAQNKLSATRLAAIPARTWIKQRLTQLSGFEHDGMPAAAGGRYFFLHSDGKRSVLEVSDRLDAPGRALVVPATGTVTDFAPGPGGKVVAYALAAPGAGGVVPIEGHSTVWQFREVQDGKELPDRLHGRGVSWARGGSGLYYSRDGGKGPGVYFHKLGQPEEKDTLVYVVTDHPTRVPFAQVTDDGHYLVITLLDRSDKNAVELIDLSRPGGRALELFSSWDASYTFIGASSERLYFLSTRNAPQGNVISVSARAPLSGATTVIPESTSFLEEALFAGNRIVTQSVDQGHSVVRLYGADGRPSGSAVLKGMGRVELAAGEGSQVFFTYSDYLTPGEVYHLDLASSHAQLWRQAKGPVTTDYVSEQLFFLTKDGTRLPMSITRRRDSPRDGNQPLLLHGFSTSRAPVFRAEVLAWLEMGGTYAEAIVRSSSMQNELNDLAAAADYLVRERYTRTRRLGLYGRGHGALAAGAAMLQRPDLFGAVFPETSLQGASYGTRRWQESAPTDAALEGYSPAQHIKPGVCYPPTFITTADRDERVAPWHAYKLAAALQAAQFCSNPILLQVRPRAGDDESMQIDQLADQWAFLAQWLGIGDLPSG